MTSRWTCSAIGLLAGSLLIPGCSGDGNKVATPSDVTPPARIRNLAVRAASESTLILGWSATGDDSLSERAARYDLRMSLRTLTAAGWDSAAAVPGLGAPGDPFTPESFTVRGLSPSTYYWFALRASDAAGNWSGISNILKARTRDDLEPAVRLTTDTAEEQLADWSPDGSRIVYVARVDDVSKEDLMVVPATGGAPEHLTEGPAMEMGARWRPDGQEILFLRMETPPVSRFFLMPAGGGEARELPGGCPYKGLCSWSPDGSTIVFACAYDLFFMPATGGDAVRLTSGPEIDLSPDWSPDGSRIVFASWSSGNSDLWVVPAEGGEPVQLTNSPAVDTSPRWSPDGSHIAFASNRSGNLDIWILPAAGGEAWPITDDPADDSAPCWSPDGNRIAFVSDRAGRQRDLWVVALP